MGGLSTPQIARAFLVPEPTIAQRLVRAKRTIRDRGFPYEVDQARIARGLASLDRAGPMEGAISWRLRFGYRTGVSDPAR